MASSLCKCCSSDISNSWMRFAAFSLAAWSSFPYSRCVFAGPASRRDHALSCHSSQPHQSYKAETDPTEGKHEQKEASQRSLLKSCKEALQTELDCISSIPMHHFWGPFQKQTQGRTSPARKEDLNKRRQTKGLTQVLQRPCQGKGATHKRKQKASQEESLLASVPCMPKVLQVGRPQTIGIERIAHVAYLKYFGHPL